MAIQTQQDLERANAQYIEDATRAALATSTLQGYIRRATFAKGRWDQQGAAYCAAIGRPEDAVNFCDLVRGHVRANKGFQFGLSTVAAVTQTGQPMSIVTMQTWIQLTKACGFLAMKPADFDRYQVRFVKPTGQTQSEQTMAFTQDDLDTLSESGGSIAGTPAHRGYEGTSKARPSLLSSFFGGKPADVARVPIRTKVAAHALGRVPGKAMTAFARPPSPQSFFDPEPVQEPEDDDDDNVVISGAEAQKIKDLFAMLKKMGFQP